MERADVDGNFGIEVHLALDRTNHLQVTVYDQQHNSAVTRVDRNGDPLVIEQTSSPPLQIILLVNPVTSPTNRPTQTITGETIPLARIRIIDRDGWGYGRGRADENGNFSIQVELTLDALNRLKVSASDVNGAPGAANHVSTTVDRNGNRLNIVQVSR